MPNGFLVLQSHSAQSCSANFYKYYACKKEVVAFSEKTNLSFLKAYLYDNKYLSNC